MEITFKSFTPYADLPAHSKKDSTTRKRMPNAGRVKFEADGEEIIRDVPSNVVDIDKYIDDLASGIAIELQADTPVLAVSYADGASIYSSNE